MTRSITAGAGTGETALPGTGPDQPELVPPARAPTEPGRPQGPEPVPPEHSPPDPAPPPRPDPTDPEPDPQTPDIPVVDPPHEPVVPEPRMHRHGL